MLSREGEAQTENSGLRGFDFFAFSEKAEGNRPYQALLEAQACGRPVVTMETALAQMTVEQGRTGLLAKDLNELPAHLLTLAQDRNRCDEMGRAGAAFVARSFSIKARARQIEELLLGRIVPEWSERAEAMLA